MRVTKINKLVQIFIAGKFCYLLIDTVLKTDFESAKPGFLSSRVLSHTELPGIYCNRNSPSDSNIHFQRGLWDHSFLIFPIFLLLFAVLKV